MLNEEEFMRRHERRRVARAAMYLLLTIAGIMALLFPSSLVEQQVGPVVVSFWSAGLAIASMGAFVGSVTDRWLGEYSALPLLVFVMFLYGISAVLGADIRDRETLPLLAYGLVVIGFSSGLLARWQDVRDLKESSRRKVNKRHREG